MGRDLGRTTWLVLALACGCGGTEPAELTDPGPGCTEDPLACPAGTTCWPVDISGRFDCLPAPQSQQHGAACKIELDRADCAAGLFCYPTAPSSGVCSPFCSGTCADGAACNDVSVNEAKYRYEVRVCAATAAPDAGSD